MLFSKFKYFDRFILQKIHQKNLDPFQHEAVWKLKQQGQVVFENYLNDSALIFFKENIQQRLERHDYEMPCLSHEKINDLNPTHQEHIKKYLSLSADELLKLGISFTKEDVMKKTLESVLKTYKPSTLKLLLSEKYLEKYLNVWLDPYILDIIESYLGMRPYLTEAYVRRNYPAKYSVMNHQWHRDKNNSLYLLKMFIFFNDCDEWNGPHEYLESSHCDSSLNRKQYYSNEEVYEYAKKTGRRISVSKVKAGTIILEDTRGLHHARIPERGYRDLGFAVFTPLTLMTRGRVCEYSIPKNFLRQLSGRQKSYLLKSCISKS